MRSTYHLRREAKELAQLLPRGSYARHAAARRLWAELLASRQVDPVRSSLAAWPVLAVDELLSLYWSIPTWTFARLVAVPLTAGILALSAITRSATVAIAPACAINHRRPSATTLTAAVIADPSPAEMVRSANFVQGTLF